jgi:hypothetical protein
VKQYRTNKTLPFIILCEGKVLCFITSHVSHDNSQNKFPMMQNDELMAEARCPAHVSGSLASKCSENCSYKVQMGHTLQGANTHRDHIAATAVKQQAVNS